MSLQRQPRLVSGSALETLIQKIHEGQRVHEWQPEEVIKYFAYLIPEGQRFTEADVEAVVRQLEIGRVDAESLLRSLTDTQNTLERDYRIRNTLLSLFHLGPMRLIERYYMLKRIRIEYQARVTKLGLDPEPERHSVSQRLSGLADKISDPQQKVFFEETLNCLRIDANRAAIVMGWNLAYDHVRRWIHRHHLPRFNAELTTREVKKNRNYGPVKNYEDFPKYEWLCLDVCEKARLIVGDEKDVLLEGLKQRNRYAHPTSSVATAAIAAGYIEGLLEHIVLNQKFAW